MRYSVLFLARALEFLESLDKPIRLQIYRKLGKLEENAKLGELLSNELKGCWRIHIGKYRVIYIVEGDDIIVTKIGHRKDVYI